MAHCKIALPAQAAAGAAVTTTLGALENSDDSAASVVSVTLLPPAGFTTVTGQATNNVTFAFRQLRGGSVVATIASLTLNAGTNLVAETPVVLPLLAGTYTVAVNDVFDVVMTQNGTGLAIGAGIIAQVAAH